MEELTWGEGISRVTIRTPKEDKVFDVGATFVSDPGRVWYEIKEIRRGAPSDPSDLAIRFEIVGSEGLSADPRKNGCSMMASTLPRNQVIKPETMRKMRAMATQSPVTTHVDPSGKLAPVDTGWWIEILRLNQILDDPNTKIMFD